MNKDEAVYRYLSDDERYADVINVVVFQGKQVVNAKDLTEQDSRLENSLGSSSEKQEVKKAKKKSKYRDLVRKTAFGVNFAIIGLENQEKVHYLMPLRCMGYDVREYEKQATKIRKAVRKRKGVSAAEYLSGFTRKDNLYPSITFVLYYGKEWDGSLDLHGLIDFTAIPQELKSLVCNYRMNLVNIREIADTDLFRTDMKQVINFIKNSEDREQLRELIESDSAYRKMDEDAYDVMATFADSKELIEAKKNYRKGEKIDMCKGLQDWAAEERSEGRLEGKIEDIRRMMKNLNLTIEVAMSALEIPEEDRKIYLERLEAK